MAFQLFGSAHLTALGLTALLALGLVHLVRRRPGAPAARGVRFALAAFLLVLTALFLGHEARHRSLDVTDLLPLHLCDFLIFVAAYALITLRQAACELLYFWSGGTLLAMLTPDLAAGFPEPYFFVFFGLHGGVVVAAAVVVFGFDRRPGKGAPGRAFRLTLIYAALVGAFDLVSGANFLFLRAKPEQPTLLDSFGPWPVYLVTVALFALLLFHLMALPFRGASRERR
jgi:hypothetical integral membrane protein (TIGR02206 family)